MSTDIREQIFRVGLNYRIGGNGAAYVPPPASNWAGFYLGGNVGGGIGRDHTSYALTGPAGTSTGILQPEPGRLQRRRPGRLQLAGRELGVRSRSRHPGLEPARQPRLRADLQSAVLRRLSSPLTMRRCPGSARRAAASVIRSDRRCSTPPAVTPMATSRPRSLRTSSARRPAQKSPTPRAAGLSAAASKPRSPSCRRVGQQLDLEDRISLCRSRHIDGSFVIPGAAGGPAVLATNSTQVHEHIFRSGLNYHFNPRWSRILIAATTQTSKPRPRGRGFCLWIVIARSERPAIQPQRRWIAARASPRMTCRAVIDDRYSETGRSEISQSLPLNCEM